MSSPESEQPEQGPLESSSGPRCPNCHTPVTPGIAFCPNCGAAMPPIPTLAGPPEENYLAGSRTADTVLGVLISLLTPGIFTAMAAVLASFGERMGVAGGILGLVWLVGLFAVPIVIHTRAKRRYPAFARAHGLTWKIQGVLFAVVILGGGALCVYLLSQAH